MGKLYPCCFRISAIFCMAAPFFAAAQPAAPCFPPSAAVDLDISKVRARIMNGGDMWWDFTNARYEVPKGSGRHSLFAGAMWIGGTDGGGQLKMAGQTYRQWGWDFWPGPLDTVTGATDESSCGLYDRLWKVNRADVEMFAANYQDTDYTVPQVITEWPAEGDPSKGHGRYLAPFYDNNGDGSYNPADGDYPGFDLTGAAGCGDRLYGDQAIWWVINDNGNVHTETGGQAIGLEAHIQAFAFRADSATGSDDINHATFYRYKLINRSAFVLNNTWFGMWVDGDIGNYLDDFVGCDVGRNLGYFYNGDSVDDGAQGGYGLHPPAIGIDLLRGPLADAGDGVDNDRDSVTDENGEYLVMSKFLYYNNDTGVQGNPTAPAHYYNYLKGIWKDSAPMTYGGSGYGGATAAHFMFPGDSDPYGWGTGGVPQAPWDEFSSGNMPSDRRAILSSGPFTLQPGAVRDVFTGVAWARDTTGSYLDAIPRLQAAADVIQAFFDSCFTGCLTGLVSDFTFTASELTVFFGYPYNATGFNWDFGDGGTSASKYPKHIYAQPGSYNVTLNLTGPCGSAAVTRQVTVDYIPPPPIGPRLQRIEGQGNGGLVVDITRATEDALIAGGGPRSLFPVYEPARGPVLVAVYDTALLQNGTYTLAMTGSFNATTGIMSNTAGWWLTKNGTADTVYSDSALGAGYTQRIPQWGLDVTARWVYDPGVNNDAGLLGATLQFADAAKPWLTGMPDDDRNPDDNWIRSGTEFTDFAFVDDSEEFEDVLGGTWAPYRLAADDSLTGPARPSSRAVTLMRELASVDLVITPDKTKWSRCPVMEIGPDYALTQGNALKFGLRKGQSVDKDGNPDGSGTTGWGWFPGYAVNVDNGERLNVMFSENSWLTGQNGRDMVWNPTATVALPPAYAPVWGGQHYIYILGHNEDKKYPASDAQLPGKPSDIPAYDGGQALYDIMATGNTLKLRDAFEDCMWVGIPLLQPGRSLLETEARIRLRVRKPYARYNTAAVPLNDDKPLYNFTIDKSEYTGLREPETAIALKVFPNPSAGDVTLMLSGNSKQTAYDLVLYDVAGNMVYRRTDIRTSSFRLSRGSLAPGLYFYTVRFRNGGQTAGRIVFGR